MSILTTFAVCYVLCLSLLALVANVHIRLIKPVLDGEQGDTILQVLFGYSKIDVFQCQRCACDHKQLILKPLKNACDEYKWFSMCPFTDQPILVCTSSDQLELINKRKLQKAISEELRLGSENEKG